MGRCVRVVAFFAAAGVVFANKCTPLGIRIFKCICLKMRNARDAFQEGAQVVSGLAALATSLFALMCLLLNWLD